MRALVWGMVLAGALVASGPAHADDRDDAEAQRLYSDGKTEYERKDYAAALAHFRQSFRLSHQAALLFNMASALKGLDRPHDAAEELRAYLRLQPDDPEKPAIDQRIAALEEEQRLLDDDRKEKAAAAARGVPSLPGPSTVAAPALVPAIAVTPTAPQLLATPVENAQDRPAAGRHRSLYIGLAIGAAVVLAAGGAALGVALSQGSEPYSRSPWGEWPATR